jgi:hypothetical protein
MVALRISRSRDDHPLGPRTPHEFPRGGEGPDPGPVAYKQDTILGPSQRFPALQKSSMALEKLWQWQFRAPDRPIPVLANLVGLFFLVQ